MLSINYFSFIIFIMIFTTMKVKNSLAEPCFNFTGERQGRNNVCEVDKKMSYNTGSLMIQIRCMECSIGYTTLRIKYNCSKDFECVILNFGNIGTFQRFFRDHSNSIPDLFPANFTILSNPFLRIYVADVGVTDITYEHMNSILNMNAPNMVININFKKSSFSSAPHFAENDRYFIRIQTLNIAIGCDNPGEWALYKINRLDSTDGKLNVLARCPEHQTTTQVSFYKYYYFE